MKNLSAIKNGLALGKDPRPYLDRDQNRKSYRHRHQTMPITDQISRNFKCRVYLCLIEFKDRRPCM
jgi:hypothetical protein